MSPVVERQIHIDPRCDDYDHTVYLVELVDGEGSLVAHIHSLGIHEEYGDIVQATSVAGFSLVGLGVQYQDGSMLKYRAVPTDA